MSRQPLIGITAGEIINKLHPWAPVVQGQSVTYVNAVVHGGGIPFILPLTGNTQVLKRLYERCDGLLMSGGNDIDPRLYGEKRLKQTVEVSVRRDRQEQQLLRWALADNKPLFGICRGMQLLNVVCGGSLYQDIDSQLPAAQNHHSSTDKQTISDLAHQLQIAPDSKLAAVLATTAISTNTHHHQAIKRLGDGLVITSRTKDDIIESIELPDKRFAIGVQSHPESLENGAETVWQKIFAGLVTAAQQYRA